MAVNFNKRLSATDIYKYAAHLCEPRGRKFNNGNTFCYKGRNNTFSIIKKLVSTDTSPGNAV